MKKNKKYKAQGFIEALVAILIGGIAVVSLMSVTVRILGQVAKNEIRDQLSQEAVLGSNLFDYIIEYRNNSSGVYPGGLVLDPVLDNFNRSAQNCFELDGDLRNPKITPTVLCSMDVVSKGINPSQCLSNWPLAVIDSTNVDSKRDSMFRIFCIDQRSVIDPAPGVLDVLIISIFTGTESCRERNVSGMKDHQSADDSCLMINYNAVYPFEIIN